MAHTYVFSAGTLNTNLFFGKTPANSSDSSSVWTPSNVTYDNNPPYRYLADSSESKKNPTTGEWYITNRRFWICGAYFGVSSTDAATIAHLASLPASKISSIRLSFEVNRVDYGSTQYFQCDTASNSTGSNFAHPHTCKSFLGNSVTSGTTITLDMTSYGVPSSGGWLIHYSARYEMYLRSAVTLTIVTTESYSLSTSAGTGSSITVNRTSSPRGGAIGNLSNGSAIYYGDVLKITFTPSQNYSITTSTVNGSSFASGGSYTATGNVSVVSTATPLRSDISATDANIGSVSTIVVTRYNDAYTHTITYSCGSENGTIVTKSSNTTIAWSVPSSLYTQIPNSISTTCTITCETFNGDNSLGTRSTTITVTAAESSCAPTVSGVVVDVNSVSVSLTGDENILIRYKSNAKCTIQATPKNGASIATKTINGSAPTSGNTTTYNGVATGSFSFSATDSRGYSRSTTVAKTLIAYVQLTCNPTIYRVTPTGGEVRMNISGAYFRGSFGAYSNTLTVAYRFKLSTDVTWGSWSTITGFTYGVDSYSKNEIVLGSSFDYRYEYDFQVQVYDGANGTVLSSVMKTIRLQRGIPVFDWGENDFNFHVPIKIGNTQLTEAQLQALLALIT